MRTISFVTGATAFVIACLVPAMAYGAPIDKICRVVENQLVCTTDYIDRGGTPAPGGDGGSGGATPTGSPTAVWTSELLYLPTTPEGAVTSAPCTGDNGEPGYFYRQTLRSTATGEVLRTT